MATKKRGGLLAELAELNDPAPRDFDPEEIDNDNSFLNKDNQEESELTGREHYVIVQKSKLRQGKDVIFDPKYRGQKSSRGDIYGDVKREGDGENEDKEEHEGEEEHDDISQELEDSNEEQEDLNEEQDNSDSNEEQENLNEEQDNSDSNEEQENLNEEQDNSDSNEEQENLNEEQDNSDSNGLENSTQDQENKNKTHLVDLRKFKIDTSSNQFNTTTNITQNVNTDIQKGKQVKKQLEFWDSVLDLRIRMQKVMTNVNSLPPPVTSESLIDDKSMEQIERILKHLSELVDDTFKLRMNLMKTNDNMDINMDLISSRKRKRDTQHIYQDIQLFESKYKPYLDTTLNKWSRKVQLSNNLPLNKKFKVINQDIQVQLEQAMADKERLLQRTRLIRGDYELLGRSGNGSGNERSGNERSENVNLNQSNISLTEVDSHLKNHDLYVLDDTDFYQNLLREFIESRMVDTNDTLKTIQWSAIKRKKSKLSIDTRASKGRKLRYHVHEKLLNFMVPIDIGIWHEEQIDELFGSLFGQRYVSGDMNIESSLNEQSHNENNRDINQDEIIDTNGLKLFG